MRMIRLDLPVYLVIKIYILSLFDELGHFCTGHGVITAIAVG